MKKYALLLALPLMFSVATVAKADVPSREQNSWNGQQQQKVKQDNDRKDEKGNSSGFKQKQYSDARNKHQSQGQYWGNNQRQNDNRYSDSGYHSYHNSRPSVHGHESHHDDRQLGLSDLELILHLYL